MTTSDPGRAAELIASVVSFVVFGAAEGFSPLFGYVATYRFTDPVQLLWFALIGVLAGVIGLLYAKGFYGLADLFKRSPVPRWAAPAIGGLAVGSIAIAIPQVIGTGYGWVQQCLTYHGLESIPLWIVLIVPLVRILATGLSIGSAVGGIFGPGSSSVPFSERPSGGSSSQCSPPWVTTRPPMSSSA